ncbi:MAG: M13 family metallopeptidase [Bryobacterales bacterium]|nr:M13 family metallopeptidase [Bryobacterales bacterium]
MLRLSFALLVIPVTLLDAQLSPIDPAVDPCTDFYAYACNVWRKENPIPAEQSRWGRFNELQERNEAILRDILGEGRGKSQDYYAACMDETTITRLGTAPLQPVMKRIAGIRTARQFAEQAGRLERMGVSALFAFGSGSDNKNSTQNIAILDQGGLSMPDRDYYLKDDTRSVEIRKKFVAHVGRMFELWGDTPAEAARKADVVMAIETALAQGHLDRTLRRDPTRMYNKMPVPDLEKRAPAFLWSSYFHQANTPAFREINVRVPAFAETLSAQVSARPLDDWKAFLSWKVLRNSANMLPSAFADESFDFFGRTLTGAREIRPRWKRCVAAVDEVLGEDLGRRFVEETFGEDGKARMAGIVKAVEQAMERGIQELDWMTPETKRRALEKLHAITNKVGYPENWRDYSRLRVSRTDALGNLWRARGFEFDFDVAFIGKPVDPKLWRMTPPTVNAYYSPSTNSINFPAGILQPPFFNRAVDEAVNFGGIGAVIGHEITHGFDDQGRRFDPRGNLEDWWTESDAREFEKRADCFVEQYAGYAAVDDMKLNGRLTLGENVADNGGLRLAYMALIATLGGQDPPKIEGFTPQQRIFLGWAQVWCQNIRPEAARMRVLTDPHSPGEHRTNGVVSNMPEFREAFGCRVSQPMAPEKRCRVW